MKKFVAILISEKIQMRFSVISHVSQTFVDHVTQIIGRRSPDDFFYRSSFRFDDRDFFFIACKFFDGVAKKFGGKFTLKSRSHGIFQIIFLIFQFFSFSEQKHQKFSNRNILPNLRNSVTATLNEWLFQFLAVRPCLRCETDREDTE